MKMVDWLFGLVKGNSTPLKRIMEFRLYGR